ncbi:MAG: hypothetical protein PUE47_08600 [Lachnospiraceae bacterium]|nr:hypothetical protein [Lachnospiraceae bacterium]
MGNIVFNGSCAFAQLLFSVEAPDLHRLSVEFRIQENDTRMEKEFSGTVVKEET